MRRPIPIEITKEQAWELFLAQNGLCHFTGKELRISNNNIANTASIDRINNELGYVVGNIRWVHKHINIMKNRYADSYFVDLCQAVTDHQVKGVVNAQNNPIATGACPVR